MNYTEAKEAFNAASLVLSPTSNVIDCVFEFYIKNYTKDLDRKKNVDEFKACLIFGNDYLNSKIKSGVLR